MSAKLSSKDILFLQRFATIAGVYNGPMNGKWNPDLDKAEDLLDQEYNKLKTSMGAFDVRSEKFIATLLPKAQAVARNFMKAAAGLPYAYKIISGTRTYAEQDLLYAQGRTLPGKIVTKARGGRSLHNFGIAWDVGIFDGPKYFTGANKKERDAYAELGAHAKANVSGIEWGGDWTSFPDAPHFQLAAGGKKTSEIEVSFNKGVVFA